MLPGEGNNSNNGFVPDKVLHELLNTGNKFTVVSGKTRELFESVRVILEGTYQRRQAIEE
jgi:hypothetical protein